jgi:hypothetical protein
MSDVCDGSLWCNVGLEKVDELGEPVTEGNDGSRSCTVTLAAGLNERVAAILLVSHNAYCRLILCHTLFKFPHARLDMIQQTMNN